MGGQGKSQVALEYCRRKKDNPYSAIFWVDATTENSLKRSFQSISECIKVETDYLPNIDARVALVLKKLSSWTIRWLIVFDNYDSPDAFSNIRNFIPQSELGAILVTSRHPDSNALVINQSNHFLELSGLEESAAIALLVQQSQTNELISGEAKKIVGRLGYHPLAVTQAGSYIRKRKLRLSEFMDHYKRRKEIILGSTPQLSQYTKRLGNAEEETSLSVFTTWELSFQQLELEVSENGIEVKLLTLLAFFDEKDISEQLFAQFCTDLDEQVLKSAKLLKWLKAFSNTEGKWNGDLFGDVLIRLRDSSLLQPFVRGLDGFYHTSLHPLVKDWIRMRIDRSICQENTYMAATLVTEILFNSWQNRHFDYPLLTKQNIISHVIASEENYQDFFTSTPYIPSNRTIFDEYMMSHIWFARFLQASGLYNLAEIIYQRVYKQNKQGLGHEHPFTLSSMLNLASIYQDQGRWKEAEELEVQVMETISSALGIEHPDTLTSMANLASTYRNQGRWNEAEKLFVQVMETRMRVLEPDHLDTLHSMAELSSTFWNQGRLKEAEKLELQVMKTSLKVLGRRNPDTLTSMGNLASIYQKQGRLKEAEELEVQVVEMRKSVMGHENPDTLTNMNNLASTYLNQGRWREAEELFVQVLETRKRVLGLVHPDTLVSMNNLASTFWRLDMKKEAIQLMDELVKSRQKEYGSNHPNTIRSAQVLQQWQDAGKKPKRLFKWMRHVTSRK